jgi:hypothetical protein
VRCSNHSSSSKEGPTAPQCSGGRYSARTFTSYAAYDALLSVHVSGCGALAGQLGPVGDSHPRVQSGRGYVARQNNYQEQSCVLAKLPEARYDKLFFV